MSRRRILLTNDDSHDSPLFHRTIDALDALGDVAIVVPATEQSWKGKSMTRYGPLYVEEIRIHRHTAFSVTGTPADCVNLGIYNLLDARPDIVVSGTNIGKNVGLGFMFASGTIGACLEANIAGLPALALSQTLEREDFHYWDRERGFRPEVEATLDNLLGHCIPLVWEALIDTGHTEPVTWNVNFPYTHEAIREIVHTRLGHTLYGACFARRGDQYHHALSYADIDEAPDTDNAVLDGGHISATRLDITVMGQNI